MIGLNLYLPDNKMHCKVVKRKLNKVELKCIEHSHNAFYKDNDSIDVIASM